MKSIKEKFALFFKVCALVGVAMAGQSSWALECYEVKHLSAFYLKMHFSYNTFDDELSRRTLDNFIRAWDPGKMYFLKGDIDNFKKKYDRKLDDMITAADCKAIEEISKLYSKRFQERQPLIGKLINDKHDFTKDEYMVIDRKKIEYAATLEEITERWRERVKFQLLQMKNGPDMNLKKARERLHKSYELAAKRHSETTADDMYSMFLDALSTAMDPHSDYMSPEELEEFRIQTRLSLEGIGAVLRSEYGYTTIATLVPGGAAAKGGKVKVGDKIISVAQGNDVPVDVVDMDLREVVKLIRGTRGTEVRLTVVREEGDKTSQIVVPIIREQVELKDKAARSTVHEIKVSEGKTQRTYKVGVIELPSFYMDLEGRQNHESGFRSSSEDVKKELEKLKKDKVDAVVVDLRSNGGGILDESVAISGLFFDKGPVVQIKDMRGETHVQSDEDGKTVYSGPLMVMINRQSASASEIVAGAIKDYERGIIVGDEHTFGKGTVQNLNDLSEKLGAIKVTISKFYRPSGKSTQLKGVVSDIAFPSLLDHYEIGEKHYDYALPWEKIKGTNFKKFDLVKPYVSVLKQRSEARVKKDENFKKVFDAIAEYKKNESERSRVSLKEEKDSDSDKKTANKKNADEKEDEELLSLEDENGERIALKDDYHLQETLRVAGDYLQLLNKRKVGEVTLPGTATAVAATKGTKAKSSSAKAKPAAKK